MTRSSTIKVDGGTRNCFTLSTRKLHGGGACARYDLRKIEFDISLGCRSTATNITFDGQPLATSYQSFPDPVNGLVFKIGRPDSLTHPLGTVAGLTGRKVKVCFALTAGPCNTLKKFCRGGKCVASFFSPNNKCCSLSKA